MVENVEYVRAKTGSEIAREMGITRQAVSQSLKRAVFKVYQGLQDNNITEGPMETVLFMQDWFGIEDQEDIQQFCDMFPSKIRDEIRLDARTYTVEQ